MHFDLINFFHLVSVISFYKKHMAAWLYLDKEQFLCSIKKKNSENWFQSREIMGVRWRAMGDLSTPCWCQDCWAELSVVLSPVPPLQWWHGGYCREDSPPCPHEGFTDMHTSKPSVFWTEDRQQQPVMGRKTDICSQQYLLRGYRNGHWKRVFPMRSLKVMSPPPNQSVGFTSIRTILATNVYHISTRYQPCAECLEYVCEQSGQRMISSCSQHGAQMNEDCDTAAGGRVRRRWCYRKKEKLSPARSRAPGWRGRA